MVAKLTGAVEQLARWRQHPAQMVRDLFGVEPDAWQAEALEAFPHSPLLAFKACKGPGKTAVLAWIGWNFLLTRPHAMVGATSISGANLKANLWTELARWRAKSGLLQHAFEQTKSEIFAKEHPKTWKMEARTWPADADATQIGNALAGVHAKFVMWLLDESGDYPDAIMPTCEGIFAGEPVEAHIVQAGNPTRLGGPLYRACTAARNLWRIVEISADPDDPKRTPRVSVEHAREQIQQYGRDNPWVLVNIFGQFPPSSLNALIGPDEVSEAMRRYKREYEIGDAPRIIGCDVARFGDDSSVLCPRQGIQVFPLSKFRNITSTQGAGLVARLWTEWNAHACFIDDTGGFGSGWIDQLRQLGRTPMGVHFAGEAHNKARYVNKRAEMYFEAVEWIKRGGALPESPELLAALTATTYTFHGDRFLIEPKDQVKRKLGYSPDEADAFVLTFAENVSAPRRGRHNPYSALNNSADWWREPEDADPYGRSR
jgi:phage terminase large subunit